MSERYSRKVREHLLDPRNVGEIEAADGVGESGDASCGDIARFSIEVGGGAGGPVLIRVRYKVYGCAACIAAGSALSEMVEGKSLVEAASISVRDIETALGGLPEGKNHALTLVLDSLHKAFEDYWTRDGEALLSDGGYLGGDTPGDGTVVAAMSGGVDSAVTAMLLRERGYDVVGVTFRLHDSEPGSRSCCSPDTVLFARDTAHRMGLPHFTLNLKDLFGKRVMSDFIGEYSEGRTPNPCIACNAHVKFHAAAYLADRIGYDKVATGHYARVADGPSLARPEDESKDQTYVLWPIPGKLLARTLFPLGDYRKPDVRRMAAERELAVATTPESQDICFIPDGDYRKFVGRKIPASDGEIVDSGGRVLGEHRGIANFTVGQRRGLGISAPTPLYVTDVQPETNRVVVGKKRELAVRDISVRDMNWFLDPVEAASVQVRYNSGPVPCEVTEGEVEGEWDIHFEEAVLGVSPGQSAVLYTEDGTRVVGGGYITRRGPGEVRESEVFASRPAAGVGSESRV